MNELMDEVKGRIPKYYNSSIQYWAPNELPNKLLRELSYLKKERCIFYSYHVLLKTFEIGTVRLIHLGINETKHVVVYPDTSRYLSGNRSLAKRRDTALRAKEARSY